MGVIGRRGRRARSGRAAPGEVVVEIDRLVLDGFGSLDGEAVGRAIETTLAGRLAALPDRDWGAGLAVDDLHASARLGPIGRERSRTVGDHIAGAVHGVLAGAVSDANGRMAVRPPADDNRRAESTGPY